MAQLPSMLAMLTCLRPSTNIIQPLNPGCPMLRRERPFPYLIQDRDRHGNERRYVRMFGRIARIREKYGTPEFAIAYAEARRALESRPQEKPIKTGAPTNRFGWLAA